MIRLQAAPARQQTENTGGQPMAMCRMLRMMAGIVVGPPRLAAFVAQHEMELRFINPHSNRVRSFERRPERQQTGQYLPWPKQDRQQTERCPNSREARSDHRASVAAHDD